MTEIGTRIRDIHLTERLGTGGMGELFVGVHERLGREVAVKVLRRDRRLEEAWRTRFKREAQILSRLEHPNICRLYDLIEEEGTEYIVLELVRGKTLREVLESGLDDAERIRIAEQVATALVAAHAMSVVHRDLKPDNIMVSNDGLVKVLDFGLARRDEPAPTGSRASAAAERPDPGAADESSGDRITRLGDVVGTPRYLSPEQARGDLVTAASDMYSFGLLMAELWTGRPPYGRDSGGRSELLQKAIWGEVEPVEGVAPDVASMIDELTALEPTERLSAAAAVERLRLIRERPRRVARRRALVSTVLVLALAAVVSGIGFWRARIAQQQAEEARSEAEAVSQFLSDMLASASPDNEGIDVKVIDLLDDAAERVGPEFGEHPAVKATLEYTLGQAFRSLGRWSEARRCFESALDTERFEEGEDARRTLQIRAALGDTIMRDGHVDDAEPMLRETWTACKERLGPDDPDTMLTAGILASCLRRLDRNEAALELTTQVYQWRLRELGEDHEQTINTRANMANLLAAIGRIEEAERLYRESVAASTAVQGPDHPSTLLNLSNFADFLIVVKAEYDEAEPLLQDILERRIRVLGEEHPETLRTMTTQAALLRRIGRFEDSERLLRSILEIRRRTLGEEHPDTITTKNSLGIVLRKLGRNDEAEEQLRAALDAASRLYGEAHSRTLTVVGNLTNLMVDQGRLDLAIEYSRRFHAGTLELYGEDHPRTLSSMVTLANVLLSNGSYAEAESVSEAALPRLLRVLGEDHPSTLNARAIRAQALRRSGRLDEAVSEFREIFEARSRTAGEQHPVTIRAREDLKAAIRELGLDAEADALESS